jgi:hypothetical protein
MQYECHITIQTPKHKDIELHRDLELLRKVIEGPFYPINWSFSYIHNDPVLGPGYYCYATANYETLVSEEDVKETLIKRSFDLTTRLTNSGYTVLRVKIEQTLFDHRFTHEKQSVQNTQNEQQG